MEEIIYPSKINEAINIIEEDKRIKKEQEYRIKEFEAKIKDCALNGICPNCLTKLKEIDEYKVWINGEFGGMAFYISCNTCKYAYSNVSKDIVNNARIYFNNVKNVNNKKSIWNKISDFMNSAWFGLG